MKKLLLSLVIGLTLSFGFTTVANAVDDSGGGGGGLGTGGGSSSESPSEVQQQLIEQSQCQEIEGRTCVDSIQDPAASENCQDTSCDIINRYLNPFIKLLAILTSVAVVIGVIYGGIQYASSGGDPQKAATARNHIRNSLLALLAFFFLYAFLRFLLPGDGLIR